MHFRGLFVGIDRYRDPRVNWLAGACRDASAVHALFADATGAEMPLLTDDRATAANLRDHLQSLASDQSSDEDVVVVMFAGHGTDDHRLVPFDASASDIAGSCIGLDELAELLTAIRARMLLCVLDCCFSGGLGSRIFTPPARARDLHTGPDITVLDRFVGEGRLVLTASADDEEALESPRHGHGLLTYRLLEALQGIDEVREGDQLNLYKLVDYVTARVQADAARMGYVQTPALRGRLEGTPTWPVLTPGSLFFERFPERARARAEVDVRSLAAFGLPDVVLDTLASSVPTLNALQLDAINEFGVFQGNPIVVTAPTSSGKTMIGELAALSAFTEHRRAIFLLPMRALVNDKYQQFRQTYEPAGVRTIRASGEHSDEVGALLGGQFDIALLTYETYSALALAHPHVLDLASTVIVDEAQILADRTRGANLEFLLTLLSRRRELTGAPQIITLSAVVGELNGLDTWLGARNLHSTVRPVEFVEGVLDLHGNLRTLRPDGSADAANRFIAPTPANSSRRLVIPLVRKLVDEGKKVIVFRQSKGEAAACAVYLAQALGLPPAAAALAAMDTTDPSTSTGTLLTTLRGGVAVHTTDLNRHERAVVEDQFRLPSSDLPVVVATPTLAMGINTPASAVVIVGLTHPGSTPTPYTVAEYKNMVGRAGRVGFAERGESYLIPEGNLDSYRAWNNYVLGTPESLNSQLLPDGDPRSLMLRVLATAPVDATGLMSEDDVVGFLDSSYAAHLARRDPGQTQWTIEALRRAFGDLTSARLIEHDGNGFRLTHLGRFAGESGVHVDSILRLAHLLSRSPRLNSVGLVTAAQVTRELDDVYIAANTRGKRTEQRTWPQLLANQGVPIDVINTLLNTSPDLASSIRRSKRAAAAALWIGGVQTDTIERELTRHQPQQGGVAGAIRAIADRTRDLLPAVVAVLHEVSPNADMDTLAQRTMLRLELGIPAELVDLAQTHGLAITRAQYLRLLAAGVRSPEEARSRSLEDLAAILNSEPAAQHLVDCVERSDEASDEALRLPTPTE